MEYLHRNNSRGVNFLLQISFGGGDVSSICFQLQCLVKFFSEERRIAEGGSSQTESDDLPSEQMQTCEDQDEADNEGEKPLEVEKCKE